METEPKRKRRSFDEAFKHDAVALLSKGDRSLKQLAQDLGVTHWNLRDWKKRYGPPAPVRSQEALEAELRAQRRELARLRTQCDILKKRWASLPNPIRTLRANEITGAAIPAYRPVRGL